MDGLQEVIVTEVPSVALRVVGRQQVTVIGGTQYLLSQAQRELLTSFAQRSEPQTLEGARISAWPLTPATVFAAQDDLQASSLHLLQGVVLLLCQARVPNWCSILQ